MVFILAFIIVGILSFIAGMLYQAIADAQ